LSIRVIPVEISKLMKVTVHAVGIGFLKKKLSLIAFSRDYVTAKDEGFHACSKMKWGGTIHCFPLE